ncbi:hypothetical protein BDY19DRAFT_521157 [Irpex rosettiformis]|uniref:Uncharacterized protein n=1 Tax=Irpex rosettiformis TaxID=378272 RepID=A0ACB8TRQ9_9APHY|nr:hypothetical protein BDY19DRAFT_521157 [Irpex rosettiformis]
MRTRSQSKKADLESSPTLPRLADVAVQRRKLSASIKTQPRQSNKQLKAKAPKGRRKPTSIPHEACEISFDLPWESHSEGLIRISRDELARLGIEGLVGKKFSRQKGPFCCECCWKSFKGAYELKRHYGTHLLKKTFKCGTKTCNYVSAQKDNCRTHCRRLKHRFIH